MEAARPDEDWDRSHPPHHKPCFHCEETDVPPTGDFLAELAGWRFTSSHHILWNFRLHPEGDSPGPKQSMLEFETGTVYRPGNHLFQLFEALGGVEESPDHAILALPPTDPSVREVVEALDPGELIGRRCRVRVEHVQDEVGDVTARITSVASPGPV